MEIQSIKPSESDKAYAAGLIDGEGCIYIKNARNKSFKRYYHKLYVAVGMTGNDSALLFLKNRWGGNISHGGLGGKQNQWAIACNDAEYFIKDILKYLILKHDQAMVAIEWQKNRIGASEELGDQYKYCLQQLKVKSYSAAI